MVNRCLISYNAVLHKYDIKLMTGTIWWLYNKMVKITTVNYRYTPYTKRNRQLRISFWYERETSMNFHSRSSLIIKMICLPFWNWMIFCIVQLKLDRSINITTEQYYWFRYRLILFTIKIQFNFFGCRPTRKFVTLGQRTVLKIKNVNKTKHYLVFV